MLTWLYAVSLWPSAVTFDLKILPVQLCSTATKFCEIPTRNRVHRLSVYDHRHGRTHVQPENRTTPAAHRWRRYKIFKTGWHHSVLPETEREWNSRSATVIQNSHQLYCHCSQVLRFCQQDVRLHKNCNCKRRWILKFVEKCKKLCKKFFLFTTVQKL